LIARIWKEAVRKHDGDAYANYMRKTGIAGICEHARNRGVWMLRRDINEHTEFLMFTLWESLDSVKAFAGQNYETAVFYPEDDRFLVEREPLATHYLVDTHIAPSDRDEVGDPGQIVKDHVAAFNEHHLTQLLACFSAYATWVTGSDRFRGTAQLATLFENTFTELSPKLTIQTMLIDGDQVACELSEQIVVDGVTRVDHIAGFYRVQSGRITTAKIYREASADP